MSAGAGVAGRVKCLYLDLTLSDGPGYLVVGQRRKAWYVQTLEEERRSDWKKGRQRVIFRSIGRQECISFSRFKTGS